MSNDTLDRGGELVEDLNPGMKEALNQYYWHLLPGMAEAVVDFAYGRQYARPGLDLKTRYLATVAGLTALGGQTQLYTRKKPDFESHFERLGCLATPYRCRLTEYGGCPVAFRPLRAVSSHGFPALVQDRAVEIAGRTGQRQSRFGARRPNGSDKQAKPVLPVREDMLHGSAYRRLPRICPRAGQWH